VYHVGICRCILCTPTSLKVLALTIEWGYGALVHFSCILFPCLRTILPPTVFFP
jgi:hypothetical protein